MFYSTGCARYMRTFYLRLGIHAIEVMAFHRDIFSNLLMLLVSLYYQLTILIYFDQPFPRAPQVCLFYHV
jgi:hypothetical protein